jgi:D-threo-aldose 1-dehydrogenase
MKTSRLASWPLPRVALGTGTWPVNPGTQQSTVLALLHHLLAGPKPLFDTAPMYGHSQSETWIGSVLREYPRDRYFVASKAGWELLPEGKIEHDLTREGIRRSVEGSLQRLGVDYLDICHLHDPDNRLQEALDTAFPALYELRDEGVIKAVGCGMNEWQMLAQFAEHADVDCLLVAGRYTLLEQTARPLLDLCLAKGIHLFAAGIYNSGVLATGARNPLTYNYAPPPPEILARVQQLEDICARHGVPLQRAAAQFPQRHPAVHTLVVGAISAPEFNQTLTALETPIPAALWAELESLGLIDPAPQS